MHPPVFSRRSLAALALSLTLCLGVSALGGAITAGPVKTWYPTIAKPAITPPDIVFPIVWPLLFIMMAVAAWLVWRRSGWTAALALFGLQLGLNLGWSALFFGAQQIGLALIEIAILWLAIAATTRSFARHDRRAAILLLPYLTWVTYAALLNALIWQMNR